MPAVLVHGVPDTTQRWDGVRSRLTRTDVVTPALPGFAAPVPSGFPATKEAYVDWHDAVDAIARPGLVLRGADDPYVTADFGERLARRTHARLVMFPDRGHWWPATKPAEVATALETLWSSTPS